MFTFLFTDIEHSSQLWDDHRAIMGEVIQQHDALISGLVQAHGGRIFRHAGDGLYARFPVGADPLACALSIQQAVAATSWAVHPFRIRISIHSGDARQVPLRHRHPHLGWQRFDYSGPHVRLTEILVSHTRGGYITLTGHVLHHYPLPSQAQVVLLQSFVFGHLPPIQVYSLAHPALPPNPEHALRAPLPSYQLPTYPGAFIGRTDEMQALRRALEQHRLVSLIGPAGVGKSRLSVETVRPMADFFPAGMLFLPLDTAPTPDLYRLLLQELNLSDRFAPSEAESFLLEHLRRLPMLLILDSCDREPHAAAIRHLLQHTERLRILVTALRPLQIPEEQVINLHGLPYAPPGSPPDIISCYPAEQLFVQRAQQQHPTFVPNTQAWEAIHRLCALVDGLPLAIELAAGWVGVLSCQSIVDELERSLDLLQHPQTGRPQRHLSLEEALSYSWQHLDAPLRLALLRLAVFQSHLSPVQAEAIGGVSEDQLQALAHHGLLQEVGDGRYRLPALFRRWCRQQWAHPASPDTQSLRLAHTRYFLSLLAEQRANLKGSRQSSALQTIQNAWSEIVTAWEQGFRINLDPHLLYQALEGLFLFLYLKGWFQEGVWLFEQALETQRQHALPMAASMALQGLTMLALAWFRLQSRAQESQQLAEQGYRLVMQTGTPAQRIWAANLLGYVYWYLERPEEALPIMQTALEQAQQIGDRWQEAFAQNYLGNIYASLHQPDQAREHYQASLQTREALGDRVGRLLSLNNLGYYYTEQQQFDAALACFEQVLHMAREAGNAFAQGLALTNLANVAMERRRYDEARHWLHEALAVRKHSGYRLGVGILYQMLGITLYRQGNLDAAQTNLMRAEAIFQEVQVEHYLAHARLHLGLVNWLRGNLIAAHARLQQACHQATHWGRALANVYLFHTQLAATQTDTALEHLYQASDIIHTHRLFTPDPLLDLSIAILVYQAVVEEQSSACQYLLALYHQHSDHALYQGTIRHWLNHIGQPATLASESVQAVDGRDLLANFIQTRQPAC